MYFSFICYYDLNIRMAEAEKRKLAPISAIIGLLFHFLNRNSCK
jgi:hypothetical protein